MKRTTVKRGRGGATGQVPRAGCATARDERTSRGSKRETLFARANAEWETGRPRSAYRLFLLGARAGDPGAEHNVGYFYDTGTGVRKNSARALLWYKRAFRHGYAAAAVNIGTMLRDEGRTRESLAWFRRAASSGDGDADLEIAKVYLRGGNRARARLHLGKVRRSAVATGGSKEEAALLLKALRALRT